MDELLRRLAVEEYGHWPNGDCWCPHCGKWIFTGDAKLTPDDFEVHRRCR